MSDWTKGQRGWAEHEAPAQRLAWHDAAKAEAKAKGIPYGKVAWLYRLKYGCFPDADRRRTRDGDVSTRRV